VPRLLLLLTLWIASAACRSVASPQPLTIGVMTDCQYCDKPDAGVRHYSDSTRKLAEALEHFERLRPEWLLHLGDFIDERYESFEPVLALCRASDLPIRHVLGNHDFSVEDRHKAGIHELLGMPARHYAWSTKGWRFIALDGNDISLHAHPEGSAGQRESLAYFERLAPRPPAYNGAIGPQQLAWLEDQLEQADALGQAAIVLCHFPVLPEDPHCLWNADEVLAVIDRHGSVRAWLNGHNHAGAHAERDGVHYLTFRGMVDSDLNAYALVELSPDRLRVRGFGREPSRELVLRGGASQQGEPASADAGGAQAAREEGGRSASGCGW
jgi:manganese-dependent ADP-ribose/CDP-alcohol diphosphatase